jgi:hypothetical protein
MATKEKLAVFQLELTHVPTEGWYCENAWMGSSLEYAKIMVDHIWNYHNDYEVKWSDGRIQLLLGCMHLVTGFLI